MGEPLFRHEPRRRLIECVCGKTLPVEAYERHVREAIRETAREVVRRAFAVAIPPPHIEGSPE